MKMKFMLSVAASAGWLVMAVAPPISKAQESFRTEVEAGYEVFHSDGGGQMDTYHLGSRYHFIPVEIAGRPWAEASFMARAGFVEVFWDEGDLEFGVQNGDLRAYGLELLWRKPGTPVAFHALYKYMEAEVAASEVTADEIGLGVGYFPVDNLYLELAYLYEDNSSNMAAFKIVMRQIELSSKYVWKSSSGSFFNAEGSISYTYGDEETPGGSTGDNTVISLSGDYYLNEQLGLGLGFKNDSGEIPMDEGQYYSARGSYFFNPRLYATLEYISFISENSFMAPDTDEVVVTLGGRF